MTTKRTPRVYNQWGGRPREEDAARCIEYVWDGWRNHQCSRKRGHGPDRLYCKQHDPDAVAARRKAAMELLEARSARQALPHTKLDIAMSALEKIAADNAPDTMKKIAQTALEQIYDL